MITSKLAPKRRNSKDTEREEYHCNDFGFLIALRRRNKKGKTICHIRALGGDVSHKWQPIRILFSSSIFCQYEMAVTADLEEGDTVKI